MKKVTPIICTINGSNSDAGVSESGSGSAALNVQVHHYYLDINKTSQKAPKIFAYMWFH